MVRLRIHDPLRVCTGCRNTCFLWGQPLDLPGNIGWCELSYVSDF